jgi:hypothetical protein
MLESNAFRAVFLKPCLGSFPVDEKLQVILAANLLVLTWTQTFLLSLAFSALMAFAGFLKPARWPWLVRKTPTRASIVGPPSSTTSIRASIGACHRRAADFFFGLRRFFLRTRVLEFDYPAGLACS